jgi:hypothetical protein
VLEEEGFTTVLQAWDFRPGSNFVQQMQQAATEAERTIAVISPDYLGALFTHPEWQAAFAQDPTGEKGKLIPVRVRETEITGLLAQIVYSDLVGLDEQTARETLHRDIKQGRGKPPDKPPFPTQLERAVPTHPRFPGTPAGLHPVLKRFRDSASLASWIFGGLILLFLMSVVFVEIGPEKFPIVRFLMALSAALLALFFVGGVLLQGTLKGLYVSATGGFALFILIQFVFNPFEILPIPETEPTHTPTPIVVSTPTVTPTNSKETSEGDKPTLLAEFVLNEKGEPQFILDKKDKVKKHYMIMFFVKDAPPDVTSITYDPWDPSFVNTYTSYAKPDFKLKPSDFTTYGDDLIKIIRRTQDSESSDIPMVLISTALERRYTGDVSDEIREVITVIKNNLQGD